MFLESIARWLSLKLRPGLSAEGRLTRLGRDYYAFEYQGRKVELQIDMLSGDPSRVIYKSSMTAWHDPISTPPLFDDLEKQRVAEVIAAYFRRRGRTVEIEN